MRRINILNCDLCCCVCDGLRKCDAFDIKYAQRLKDYEYFCEY